MKLLILGGTQFVGRHIVEQALVQGHEVELFNRGNNIDLFPDLKTYIGDRNEDLSVLENNTWDAVIDVSGYNRKQVQASAKLLKDASSFYCFISSISVYAQLSQAPISKLIDENSALKELKEPTEEITAESYGPLKAVCEQDVQNVFDKALIIRPGFIVGPYDHTDRFSYWPYRVAKGGQMLAPYAPNSPMQYIDARDLATWIIDMTERQITGSYNAVNNMGEQSIADILETSRRLSNSDAEFVWLSSEFLQENDVGFQELPIIFPIDLNNAARLSNKAAVAEGLKFTSLEDTIKATLNWLASYDDSYVLKAGLKPDKEKELLAKWNTEKS